MGIQDIFNPAGVESIGQAVSTMYNIAASTVVKAGVGRLARVSVITAGAAGTVNDCATVGAAAIGNQIGVIPATVGIYYFDWPYFNGLTYVLGAGQVIAVSYI